MTNIDLTEISKANDEEKVTKTKIFKDSLVLIDEENKFNFLGFKQKGIYKFIEDKNNLKVADYNENWTIEKPIGSIEKRNK